MYLSLPRFWNADWTILIVKCATTAFVVATFIVLVAQSAGFPLIAPGADLASVTDRSAQNSLEMRKSPHLSSDCRLNVVACRDLPVIGLRQRALLNLGGQRETAIADIPSDFMPAPSDQDAPQ